MWNDFSLWWNSAKQCKLLCMYSPCLNSAPFDRSDSELWTVLLSWVHKFSNNSVTNLFHNCKSNVFFQNDTHFSLLNEMCMKTPCQNRRSIEVIAKILYRNVKSAALLGAQILAIILEQICFQKKTRKTAQINIFHNSQLLKHNFFSQNNGRYCL